MGFARALPILCHYVTSFDGLSVAKAIANPADQEMR